MKSIHPAKWLAILMMVYPSVASAQGNSIYSWTDENGVKHFSDRAPANVEAVSQQAMPAPEADPAGDADNPTDTINNEPLTNTMEDATAEQSSAADDLSYADQQRLAIAERRDAEKQKQVERDQLCLKARDQLARIEPNRRVFQTDDDGNTTRLDDEERVRMVEESKSQIAAYCD